MLYVLHRLLTDANIAAVMLETYEDAAFVGAEQTVIDVVQVKSERSPLTAAALRDSTISRRALLNNGEPHSLVSYSGFGAELTRAKTGDAHASVEVAQTLRDLLADKPLEQLFSRLNLVHVEEQPMVAELRDILAHTIAGANPSTTIELLSYWLAIQSEARATVTRQQALERVIHLARYVENLRAAEAEWFKTIEPIVDQPELQLDTAKLVHEFCAGIAARREHILANADIPRFRKIEELDNSFRESQTVIVHGASGQGKSTLALRYMEDHAPAAARFSVRNVRNDEQALRITHALSAHVDALGMSIFVHIDVARSDEAWAPLLEELSRDRSIRTLVTLREEDWRRSGDLLTRVDFRSLSLSFDEDEARAVFAMLQERDRARFPSFEDAWQSFDHGGPLLEFTYLVTQHGRLASRLEEQVRRLSEELREDELVFAQAIMCAAECDARISLSKLVASCSISNPIQTVARLSDEYIIRRIGDDEVVGLHPIRSRIMTGLLTDSTLRPLTRAIQVAVQVVIEDDLEDFLLHAYSNYEHATEDVCLALTKRRLTSWSGVGAALRGQLWLGLKRHMAENRQLFEEAGREFMIFGIGMFMDASLGKLSGIQPMIEAVRMLNPQLAERVPAFIARLPNRIAFLDASAWIRGLHSLPSEPASANVSEWLGVADFLFWIHTLQVGPQCVVKLDIAGITELSSAIAAQCYLSACLAGEFKNLQEHDAVHKLILSRFIEEYEILSIECDPEAVTADYILPEEVAAGSGDVAVSEALIRVEILHCLFPQHGRVHVRGCNQLRELDLGDAEKRLDASTIELPWERRLRRTLANLTRYAARPDDWPAYVEAVRTKCKMVTDGVRWTVSRAYEHLTGKVRLQLESPLDDYARTLGESVKLPKTAVERWGRTIGTGARYSHGNIDDIPVSKHRAFEKAAQAFLAEITAFFTNANMALISVAATARRPPSVRANFEKLAPSSKIDLAARNLRDASRLYAEFATSLRDYLGSMILNDGLILLSDSEMCEARDVWRLLSLQPHAIGESATAVRSSANRLVSDWKRKRQRDLRRLLERRLSRGTSVTIVDQSQDLRSVVVIVNCGDYRLLDSAIRQTVDATADLWRKAGRLATAIYEVEWESVLVIPCVHSRALTAAARRLSSLTLAYSTSGIFPYGIPFEVDDDALRRLRLEAWDIKALSPELGTIAECVVAARLLAARVDDVWNTSQYYPMIMDSYEERQKRQLHKIAMRLRESLERLPRGTEIHPLENERDQLVRWAGRVAARNLCESLEELELVLAGGDQLVEHLLHELTMSPL
ncbi:MAG TPA: hypothetical protein VNO30_29420 [Kofleriaceae bacterium]|nr:hypothetical protein [Kofleriaceae bacterium]